MQGATSAELAREFVALIHSFGVLRSDSTPCGQPMSVSSAHALCELRARGALSQRELAEQLGLKPSSVSRLLDQLEARTWTQRRPAPTDADQRTNAVVLTNAGTTIADQVLAARSARFERLLECIPVEQQPNVISALRLLKEAANEVA
ncbi:MAG: MarR family transcriptional regulator [Candidatus Nanopelagicales bacterium]|jgi:DNA-binding MarR family transcriptional regulator|nr:hypothetical protein [Actinomycetota bacterium]